MIDPLVVEKENFSYQGPFWHGFAIFQAAESLGQLPDPVKIRNSEEK